MEYSVAIRTLGTSPDTLRRELECLNNQTIKPRKVCIYIAEGYLAPDFRVADEVYISVPKGMIAQRALDYSEIDTPYILMLDDDVTLERDSAEKLLAIIDSNGLDAVVADVFLNHEMGFLSKTKALLTAGVRPLFGQKKAIRVYGSGTFGYINNPVKDWYYTESGAGPAAMWRKDSWLALDMKDELWMDRMRFSYGDDQLTFNKAYRRGMATAMAFRTGFVHVDARSASNRFRGTPEWLANRITGIYLLWHRSCYRPTHGMARTRARLGFFGRSFLLAGSYLALGVKTFSIKPVFAYFRGLSRGKKIARSNEFRNLNPFLRQ